MNEVTKESRLTKKQQRIIAVTAIAIAVIVVALICYYIGRPLIEFISEPDKFRSWVDQRGFLGRILYMGIVIIQIAIAIIPGEPVEIAGGYAFGFLEGTLLYLAASALGSVLVFLLVRKYGVRLLEIFFSKERIESLNFLKKNRKRYLLFFLIFMIPGTPKDLLCYYAGLTDMKLSTFLIISSIGRLPALITSTIGGDALGVQSYAGAIIVFAVTLVASLIGICVYKRIHKENEK